MLSADSYQNSHSLFSACLCVGSISVYNTSNPSHLFNLMAPYFDTSSNDKKTILPLKNFTPAHWFRIQPAHCFTKHKLKIFFSLSPLHSCLSFYPLSQQPGTSPQKAKPLSLPSLLLPKLRWSFKLVRFRCRQRWPISLFNKKISSFFLMCEAIPSPNSHGVNSLFLVRLFPLSLPIYLCAFLLCVRIFFFFFW